MCLRSLNTERIKYEHLAEIGLYLKFKKKINILGMLRFISKKCGVED